MAYLKIKGNIELPEKEIRRLQYSVVDEVAKDALEDLIEETPFGNPNLWLRSPPRDYRPGRAKASWSLIKYPIEVFERTGKFGLLYNSTLYLKYINEGRVVNGVHQGQHSKQADLYFIQNILLKYFDSFRIRYRKGGFFSYGDKRHSVGLVKPDLRGIR